MVSVAMSFILLFQTSNPSPPSESSILFEYITNPFVICIYVLFLTGAIALIRYMMQLPGQSEAMNRVQKNYDELIRTGETNPEAIRAELLKHVDRKSITAHRLEELHWIGVHGGDFDQLALAEVLAAREGARISIARYAASVLVLVGLCGAVYGLSNVVVDLGPELKEVQEQLGSSGTQSQTQRENSQPSGSSSATRDAFSALLDTMSDSLVHTRGAFFASLTGILASVVLLLANWKVGLSQVDFITKLEDLTATKLIPLFKPPSKETELAGAIEAFREGSDYLVRLSDDLDSKMTQVGGGLENLFTVVRKFSEVADELQANQSRVYEAQSQMIRIVEEFVGLASRFESNQAESKLATLEVMEAVRESNRSIDNAIHDWKSRHEDLLLELQSLSRQAHSDSTNARETAKDGISRMIDLIQGSFDRQLESLNIQTLSMIEKQQINNHDHMKEVLVSQGHLVQSLQDSIASSNGHRELLAGVATTIEGERRIFTESLKQVIEKNNEAIRDLISEQKHMLDVSGMRFMEKRLENFTIASQQQFSDLATGQKQFTAQMAGVAGQLNAMAGLMRMLASVAIVSIPVFAVLALMFVLGIQPTETWAKVLGAFAVIGVVGLIVFFITKKQ